MMQPAQRHNPDFYADPENLRGVLAHHLAVYSEGHTPNVPILQNFDGSVNVSRTLALSCFDHFPASERTIWLEHHPPEKRDA